ncbi:hypothetical protein MMC26_003830 [Xylographa opegraphella]|nr:hypothetical protein [Xylographa opegraphella]
MTIPQQKPLFDYVKSPSHDDALKRHALPDVRNINPQNGLSRQYKVNRTNYPLTPAINSRRQLAGQNARIQQQPTRLEHSRPLFAAPDPVNLSEVASHPDAELPWPSKDSKDLVAHIVEADPLQHQNNNRDGFDTDIGDDFDDTTTISDGVQVGDSQTHHNQSVATYDEGGNTQEPVDSDNVRGISTHVESFGMDHAGYMAARSHGRYNVWEGADYAEDEDDSESDSTREGEGAEDDPTLDISSMSALIPPATAQALERELDAMQNTIHPNQQVPGGSLGNLRFPPTSDHEAEDLDLPGHLPCREVVYRGRSSSPGFFHIPSAKGSESLAITHQQGRNAYAANFRSPSGMDVLQSNPRSQTSVRPTGESLCVSVLTKNTTSAQARPSRPLQHHHSMEVARQPANTSRQHHHDTVHDQTLAGEDQQRSVQLQKIHYISQEWSNGRTPEPPVSGVDLNENLLYSPPYEVRVDEKVLPLRKNPTVGQLPHQSEVISARGQKRIIDLDYTEDQLSKTTYDQLRSESFDFDPTGSVQIFPEEVRSGPLIKQFEFVKDLKDLTDEQRSEKLYSFFSSLTMDKYEECGDMVLGLFSDILTKYKDARQEKRKIATKYEEEISHREQTVGGASLRVDKEMKRIRQAGSDLLKGSGA